MLIVLNSLFSPLQSTALCPVIGSTLDQSTTGRTVLGSTIGQSTALCPVIGSTLGSSTLGIQC